ALYAIKRELFHPFEEDLVLDDMMLPLRVALGGHRFVFASEARAYDVFAESLEREFKRKVRTLAGNFQALRYETRLLRRENNPAYVHVLFHKVGRLALPWLMVLALLASGVGAWLGDAWIRSASLALTAAQLLFYAAALAGEVLVRAFGRAGPL